MILKTISLETQRLFLKRGNREDYYQVYEYDFTKLRNINGEFEFVKQDLSKIDDFVLENDLEQLKEDIQKIIDDDKKENQNGESSEN